MNRIRFKVLGPPQAQKRHRSWQRGKFKGTYDPSAVDKADFLALCVENAPEHLIEGAVILRLVFWMPVPKGATKRFKTDVEDFDIGYATTFSKQDYLPECVHRGVAHTKARFDADNNLKFVMDALEGVYWQNDGQVQIGWAYKIYSHRPRTEIEIIY